MVIVSSLRSRGRSHAVVNAIERCGKPDMVFHAVLRYPSVRETGLDHRILPGNCPSAWCCGQMTVVEIITKSKKKIWLHHFQIGVRFDRRYIIIGKLNDIGDRGTVLFVPRCVPLSHKRLPRFCRAMRWCRRRNAIPSILTNSIHHNPIMPTGQ